MLGINSHFYLGVHKFIICSSLDGPRFTVASNSSIHLHKSQWPSLPHHVLQFNCCSFITFCFGFVVFFFANFASQLENMMLVLWKKSQIVISRGAWLWWVFLVNYLSVLLWLKQELTVINPGETSERMSAEITYMQLSIVYFSMCCLSKRHADVFRNLFVIKCPYKRSTPFFLQRYLVATGLYK